MWIVVISVVPTNGSEWGLQDGKSCFLFVTFFGNKSGSNRIDWDQSVLKSLGNSVRALILFGAFLPRPCKSQGDSANLTRYLARLFHDRNGSPGLKRFCAR